jgi:predicted dinucleotide-binding enzyme
MRIGILGGGAVGQTLGEGFARLGHAVMLGIRAVTDETLDRPRNQARTLRDWKAATGAPVVTLREAAEGAEVVVNATNGGGSLAALDEAGGDALAGKPLIDVVNPLDYSRGMPPFLIPDLSGPTSLAERIQSAFPRARIAKAFNTVPAAVVVNSALVPGEHDLFLCGDEGAKGIALERADGLGWRRFVDLGDIAGARVQEAFVLIWIRLWMVGGDPLLGYRILRR